MPLTGQTSGSGRRMVFLIPYMFNDLGHVIFLRLSSVRIYFVLLYTKYNAIHNVCVFYFIVATLNC